MPEPDPSGALCVLCRREPVDPAWRPFCSERCKLRDLVRWVDGNYRVPGEEADQTENVEPDSKKDSEPSSF